MESLENKVAEVYGSKAYKMLQKMSLKANKKDYEDGGSFNQLFAQDESSKVDDTLMSEKKAEFSLGQGIGKHGQGILNPIEPEMKPAKGGVGSAPV